jgi:cysteine synthase
MQVYSSVLEMIGRTPLLRVNRFDTGVCELYLKLELMNPAGSIKDRIGVSMIEEAERRGDIKPGDTLVEATAGNTGLGVAVVAAQKGYKLVLVLPDKMSQEKIFNLRAMGAEVILTRSDVSKGHPEYYQDLGERLARERGAYYLNQFANPDNPKAHEATTGPEIWEQMQGRLDAIVVGVGSSGTIAGLAHFFKRTAPNVELIVADPQGSVIAEYVRTGKLIQKGSAGRGYRRGLHPQHLRLLAHQARVRDLRHRILRHRARVAPARGPARGLIDGYAARRRAALLPRADAAEARGDLRLRHRQQVSLQALQRFLDGGPGLHPAQAARRSARPDRATPQRACHGHRGSH